MRHAKAYFILLLCCLLPLTAYAGNKKIVISCTKLTAMEIKQTPRGALVQGSSCGDKCFYVEFIMNEHAAKELNTTYNASKHLTRDIYMDDHLLGTAEPLPLDIPYAQKVGSAQVHLTLEEATDEARKACPHVTIKVPDVVRR